jgi:hypothetical protein
LYQLNFEFCSFFGASRIHVGPTDVAFSISPPRCRLYSDRHRHTAVLYHTSFLWSLDELAASASSFSNVLSCHVPSRAETEALNLQHHYRLPSPDRPTPTLNCYKKVTPTLCTLPTSQPHLHFASFLTRAPRHQSFTHRRRSLSSSSYIHRPSIQRHPW